MTTATLLRAETRDLGDGDVGRRIVDAARRMFPKVAHVFDLPLIRLVLVTPPSGSGLVHLRLVHVSARAVDRRLQALTSRTLCGRDHSSPAAGSTARTCLRCTTTLQDVFDNHPAFVAYAAVLDQPTVREDVFGESCGYPFSHPEGQSGYDRDSRRIAAAIDGLPLATVDGTEVSKGLLRSWGVDWVVAVARAAVD